MISAERLKARMAERQLSQSELARRVRITQATIYKLVSGQAYGSTHLHKIARELGTTPAYLVGETDDPDEGAPPPPPEPRYQMITLPVALPSEAVLTQMFQGVLLASESLHGVALARELARQLPKALGLARGPLIEVDLPDSTREDGQAEEAADDEGDALPEQRRARRR